MKISSNVCTDMDYVPPFRDRFGLTEVPIFLEDGGVLWNKHPLAVTDSLKKALQSDTPYVLLIHPMHFVINTPYFDYMLEIKQKLSRQEWRETYKNQSRKLPLQRKRNSKLFGRTD